MGDLCLFWAWMAYFQRRSLSFSREGNLSKKSTQKGPQLDTKLVLWKNTTHEWRRHESFKVRSHQTIPQKKPQVKVEIVPWYPCYHQYTLLFKKKTIVFITFSHYLSSLSKCHHFPHFPKRTFVSKGRWQYQWVFFDLGSTSISQDQDSPGRPWFFSMVNPVRCKGLWQSCND